MNYKKKKFKPENQNYDEEALQVDLIQTIPEEDSDGARIEAHIESDEVCPICRGSGRTSGIVKHKHTQLSKMVSIVCPCYTSKVVSAEFKLLHHFGHQYLPIGQLDHRLDADFRSLGSIPNFVINGNYDSFLFHMKSLIMMHRFDSPSPGGIKPRILLSRSIDIVHEFHVPQDDGVSRHLSATSAFDLVVVVFGSMEVNKAIAPCMIQLVTTRLEEHKPTWIYFRDIMTPKSQEYSDEIVALLEKFFRRINVETGLEVKTGEQLESKRLASKF